jgi:hypothetical protein
MVIEIRDHVDKRKDQLWAKETVNALTHYNSMLKNPNTKMRNTYGNYLALFIVYLILSLITLGFSFILDFEVYCIILLVVCLLFWLFISFMFFNLKHMASSLLKNRGDLILTVDEKGLELAKANHQLNRYGWDHVALVKLFSYSVVVYTKEKSVVSFPIGLKDQILSAFQEQGKGDLCYFN